jgi:hypothetical protein
MGRVRREGAPPDEHVTRRIAVGGRTTRKGEGRDEKQQREESSHAVQSAGPALGRLQRERTRRSTAPINSLTFSSPPARTQCWT